jgi:hypothetical protein
MTSCARKCSRTSATFGIENSSTWLGWNRVVKAEYTPAITVELSPVAVPR